MANIALSVIETFPSFGQELLQTLFHRASSLSEHLHTIFVNSAREKTGKLKTPLAPAILAREGYFVVG
jgi:hypothetical protein